MLNPFDSITGSWRDLIASVSERNSTLYREVLGGFVIYLSLVYIFIVNPEILSSAGTAIDPMPASAILIATVFTSAIATILMGFFAGLPFAVAPGLEVSTFFTYVLVRGMHFSWRQALAAVFISGIINLVLTLFAFRERIVEAIPAGLKAGLLLAVGSFIALVGLKIGGLVDVGTQNSLAHWSLSPDLKGPFIMLLGAILCFAVSPSRFVLPFGIVLSVIVCTGVAVIFGIRPPLAQQAGGGLERTTLAFLHNSSLPPEMILNFVAGTLILFVIDFVGGVGKIVALTTHTSMQTRAGGVPKLKQALFIDGGATVVGGIFGTSSLIAFVESRLGIESGARTGIAAIVCGALMFSGLFYTNVFRIVPPIATAGILLYIGILLLRVNADILRRSDDRRFDLAVGAAMALSVLATFQLDWAMFVGFTAYFGKAFRSANSDRSRRASLWLAGVALVLGVSVLVPLFVSLQR